MCETQTVTLRGSGLLLMEDCGWYVSVANCFLIRCESVSRILILFRDHYGARGNLSVLIDDSVVSRNFNIKTQRLMGRWKEHQTWWLYLLQSHYWSSSVSVWGTSVLKVNHKLTGAWKRLNIPYQHVDCSQKKAWKEESLLCLCVGIRTTYWYKTGAYKCC